MAVAQTWQNRIVGSGEEAPDQLLANPVNWRVHPRHQQEALAGVLDEVGWVQQVIVNQRTGHLIDGHLRVALAMRRGEPKVPVLYVDLDPEEEALVLATLDPLAAMAAADAEKLDELLRDVSTSEAAVQEMLSMLAAQNGLLPPDDFNPEDEWVGMPAYEQEDKRPAGRITVYFQTREAIAEFGRLIGQGITEKTKWVWFPARPPEEPVRWVE